MIDQVLKPKSQEEIEDLEKRGFRKNTGKWRFVINISSLVNDYNKNEDVKEFKTNIYDLLSQKVNDVYLYASKEQGDIFKQIIDKFKKTKTTSVDKVDDLLAELYDWADNNDVWLESC